jgi:flagellar protein FlbD
MLTRLGGQPMAVNPDLMEKAEATPDTVITLVDGHKFVVAESVEAVVQLVRVWRASVAAEAFALSSPAPPLEVEDDVLADAFDPDIVDEAAAVGSGGGPLARVLHLPAREE